MAISRFNEIHQEENFMKLNMGDRIKYNDSIYTVAAVLFATVYLRAVEDNSTQFNYNMDDIYYYYKDIEFLGKKEQIYD